MYFKTGLRSRRTRRTWRSWSRSRHACSSTESRCPTRPRRSGRRKTKGTVRCSFFSAIFTGMYCEHFTERAKKHRKTPSKEEKPSGPSGASGASGDTPKPTDKSKKSAGGDASDDVDTVPDSKAKQFEPASKLSLGVGGLLVVAGLVALVCCGELYDVR